MVVARRDRDSDESSWKGFWLAPAMLAVAAVLGGLVMLYLIYIAGRIDVPSGHIAVLTRKTGKDITNDELIAPDAESKGIQSSLLTEGRYFYNPYSWDWGVYPMIDVPANKMGVRVRQFGKNLPYGQFLSQAEDQKGIISEVLRPGRYPLNAAISGKEKERDKQDYVEVVELHDPIIVSAGFRGVVTNLAGPFAVDPNVFLVPKGSRGVQKETLGEGTYYMNPYEYKINIVDCRSQRLNLAEEYDLGFPSRDGFWISLGAIVEYRIKPERAAEVFVTFNETKNDHEGESPINDELVKKVIMPAARSFCRISGSNRSGREFIGGDTRITFQKSFQDELQKQCSPHGIEIVQALITRIKPPQQIAKPVQDREVSRQNALKFHEQKLQQDEEAKLAIEKALINQKQKLVQARQTVVKKTTEAERSQKVEVTQAEQAKAVAKKNLEAVADQSEAITFRKKAEASIIDQQNIAEAAGWKKAVQAFGGDGDAYAKYTLFLKLAPAFKNIFANSADSPLMGVFDLLKTKDKEFVKPQPSAEKKPNPAPSK